MKVGIIGPAGFSGSHIARELLNRGHHVVGSSRTPERLGKHANYTPVSISTEKASVADLVTAFTGLDVLVNAYNPSPGPGVYKIYLETTRRIILAIKTLTASHQNIYLISIGGTASLPLASPPGTTAGDSRPFWLAYLRATTGSHASVAHMAERMGPDSPMIGHMQNYRTARQALLAGTATPEQQELIERTERPIIKGPEEPTSSDLPLAARVAFMMFESVPAEVMTWTFVSPPARFRPGPRTGKYDVWVDELPLAKDGAAGKGDDASEFDDKLLGVSAADLAVAVADEAENRAMVSKHWAPVSEWEGDEAFETYVKLR